MAKGIAPQEAMEIVIDEHPVKGSVESHKDQALGGGNLGLEPFFKAGHSLGRRQATPGQLLERQTGDRQGLCGGVPVHRLQLDAKGAPGIGHQACANREQRVLGWVRAGSLDVNGNVGLGKR